MISGTRSISFTRWLAPELNQEWGKILNDNSVFQLEDVPDMASWKLENRGKFSVKSTYNALTSSDGGPHFKYIWKAKIPPKNQDLSVVSSK